MKSKLSLKIKGKNINRFIKRVINHNIEILSLKYLNKNEIIILIYAKDYQKIMKIKSIYEINPQNIYGTLKIKKNIKANKYLIISFITSLTIFIFLTNIIFDIEIVHSNKEIRQLIKEELTVNGIQKYKFKKNYNELTKIKEKIINAHPDKIEWLEIEEVGTKYIVRLEEREIIKKQESNKPQNIVAKKDAVIKKVLAEKGDIVKDHDQYVKKGETIISGDVMLNENVMGRVKAKGKVYGEVWYVVKTSYPFVYYEEKETGKKQDIYKIKFINHNFEITLNKFKHKKTSEKIIFQSNLLPLKLVKDSQKEIKIKNQILTFDEALIKAQKTAISKMNKSLDKNEYIIKSKYLKSSVNNSTIDIEMFFAIYEDITDYKEIELVE